MKKIINLNNPAEETKTMLVKKGSGYSSISFTENTCELLKKYEGLDTQIKKVLDELVTIKLKLETINIVINLLHELRK